MNVEVHNISYASATVSWSTNIPCPESYSHNLHREERVPHALSSLVLRRLNPSTVYITCVACKHAFPSSNHCMPVCTLNRQPLAFGGSGHTAVPSLRVGSSLLLLCFMDISAYGCLQCWSPRGCKPSRPSCTNPEGEPGEPADGTVTAVARASGGILGGCVLLPVGGSVVAIVGQEVKVQLPEDVQGDASVWRGDIVIGLPKHGVEAVQSHVFAQQPVGQAIDLQKPLQFLPRAKQQGQKT
uniref:Fibronectin type III domain containing 9 n=1 Tax=Crocodylus porosus TaxID=8502 RepID=A0A7M4F3N7_CROPO